MRFTHCTSRGIRAATGRVIWRCEKRYDETPQSDVIVLLKDNPGDAYLLRMVVGEAWPGLRLIHFETGKDALAFLRRQTPRLILADLYLGEAMTGCDFIEIVRGIPKLAGVPIVVLTGFIQPGDEDRCHRAWCNDNAATKLGL